VVAVTGDDNSGGLTTTDTAGTGEDVPAAGHQPGEESAGTVDAEDQDIAGGEVLTGTGTAPGDTVAEVSAVEVSTVEVFGAETGVPAGDDEADDDEADDDEAGDGVVDDAGRSPDDAAEEAPAAPDLEQESEIAADYIEGLLDVADLDGDIDMDVEGDRPVVSVVGATLEELVGPRGEVLEALQELTRLAVHRQTGMRSRIMLDVGGYRARRRRELADLGKHAAEQVSKTGVPQRLQAMTPFERKVIHDAVAAAGLRSESEGEEPDRRVVVLPAGDTVGAGVGEPAAGQGTGT
jgi:spoIIIJ-associated protein